MLIYMYIYIYIIMYIYNKYHTEMKSDTVREMSTDLSSAECLRQKHLATSEAIRSNRESTKVKYKLGILVII